MIDETPIPTEVSLLQKAKELRLTYADNVIFLLPFEYLRISSPSASEKSKKWNSRMHDINIISVEPVGNYALKLIFSDGHQSGLYSWSYLHDLAINQQGNWEDYIESVEQNKSTSVA